MSDLAQRAFVVLEHVAVIITAPVPALPAMQIPEEKPSKTRRKRDMHELQALGESLVTLDDDEIDRLPIDERLADAVRQTRTIRSREARRRQLQFIGRLMRDVDADALRAALAEIRR